jgi:hypothetical protein
VLTTALFHLAALVAVGVYPGHQEPLPPLEDLRRFPAPHVVDGELLAFERRAEEARRCRDTWPKDSPQHKGIERRLADLERQAGAWYRLQEAQRGDDCGDGFAGATWDGQGWGEDWYVGDEARRFLLAVLRDWVGRGDYAAGVLPSLYFVQD